ncbi:MAG: prepilin peptidase, partial [Isosphaeraceae bacterium]|nr:prepilin peptidase [Isosphaeraceae bacterium]
MNSSLLAYHIACALWFFALGAVVGSFLNVCIYRLPWQKSVIWPASHCPKCLSAIAAWDNVPILSWAVLRGACRQCGLPISARYALVEALVGLLFVAAYAVDVGFGASALFSGAPLGRLLYHQILLALLVAATFTDIDWQIIPAEITETGMVLGVLLGALFPDIRPAPSTATTTWAAFDAGVIPALIGGGLGGLIQQVLRWVPGRKAKRRADMPEVSIHWAALGAFLGWQYGVLPHWRSWGGLVVGLQG